MNSNQEHIEQEEHWVSVSDLMAGLMMVFLLVAIVFMVNAEIERNKVRDVAILYDRLRTQLYQDLVNEFAPDLDRWGAEIDPDLSIRFNREELTFAQGESNLRPEFEGILSEFFPRYLRIITSEKYRHDIAEVRIEGHTSSGWAGQSEDDAYILNMGLSQARTRSALDYVLNLNAVETERDWLKEHMTANGLSSSKPVLNANGNEDSDRSRRVEFRVRTDAESRIASILESQL
ncbi:cell envelope biogenesis protein OmpA [Saccharospirillum sp. MSK14-1]|uniref:OmpA family protein n=1 Tax=Saccharospirillum sp. MSK14-1 TaxID=1897632 RepID=UPI000D36B7D6|nr:OmpA family protein [Saccharospirillum sp. MSK14-1]PTY37147.1 cell envelope biogenesis protein OmpA [Saccharospirillum sp. MSK14-1]